MNENKQTTDNVSMSEILVELKQVREAFVSTSEILTKLKQVQDELTNLRRLLIMKEICPDLMPRLAPRINLPEGEIGETYGDFFRRKHQLVKGWIIDAYFQLNDAFTQYPSSKFVLEDQLRRAEFLAENDADHLAFYNVMGPLMFSLSKQDFAKEYFERFAQNPIMEKCVGQYFWYRLINYFLESSDEEKALSLLFRFRKKFGEAEIPNWLPIADLAYRNGSKEYSLQSAIFQQLVKNAKEYTLEMLFAHKKIALIGNGPQEKGRSLGEYIDSFDFIIRFNDYNLTPEYVKDYGSRCDLQYRNIPENNHEHFIRGNPQYSFMGCSPWSFRYDNPLISRIEKEMNAGHIHRVYTYSDQRYVLSVSGNLRVSSGVVMIALIHKVNQDFTQSNCFGFSFKDEGKKVWSHPNGVIVRHPIHNLTHEQVIIQKIFAEQ